MREPVTVSMEHTLNAPLKQVFACWTEKHLAQQWLYRQQNDELLSCTMDVRNGGNFRVSVETGKGTLTHFGKYLSVQPLETLRMTLEVAGHPGVDTVDVRFQKVGDETKLLITHSLAPEWEAYARETPRVWADMLSNLDSLLAQPR